MKTMKLLLPAALFLLLAACSEDTPSGGAQATKRVALDSDSATWTYVSLETGRIVGTAPLGDTAADSLWAERDDWDIAICGDLVRTNGGTSGHGQGAIGLSDQSYPLTTAPPAEGLQTDTDTVEVW